MPVLIKLIHCFMCEGFSYSRHMAEIEMQLTYMPHFLTQWVM